MVVPLQTVVISQELVDIWPAYAAQDCHPAVPAGWCVYL